MKVIIQSIIIYLAVKNNIYNFSVIRNNEIIFDLVPCYRKADDVRGMYDLVNGVFYENKGTGNFEKGNNLN